jgi:Reverse transcriptase (RNA-dependent DNA polymerase)
MCFHPHELLTLNNYQMGLFGSSRHCFFVHGNQQVQNVDYFKTFSPVMSWTTIHLMLIVSSILDLSTVQADYTAVFLHAPIEEDIYVHMPRSFDKPGMVLKLKQCLYGLKQSPRNFFLHLKAQLGSGWIFIK